MTYFNIYVGTGDSELSIRVQKKLLSLGYRWAGGSTEVKTCSRITYLWVTTNGIICWTPKEEFELVNSRQLFGILAQFGWK